MHAKTGIAHRRLKPTLGLVDPENTKCGLSHRLRTPDLLFQALAPGRRRRVGLRRAVPLPRELHRHPLRYASVVGCAAAHTPTDSRPMPERPLLRPAYQVANEHQHTATGHTTHNAHNLSQHNPHHTAHSPRA